MLETVSEKPEISTPPRSTSLAGQLTVTSLVALVGSFMLTAFTPIAGPLMPGGLGLLLNALLLLALVAWATYRARPANWRVFLRLEQLDWRGIVAGIVLFAAWTLAQKLVLDRYVLGPISATLAEAGLGRSISFYETNLIPVVPLVLPASEELFFRGYLQNRLQGLIGPTRAFLLVVVLWSLWHFWAPQEFVRRILAGLWVEGLLFRLRQSTWPSLVIHIGRVFTRAFVF